MSDLVRRFAAHLAGLHLEPGPAIVAVSGGPDSLALLYLLYAGGLKARPYEKRGLSARPYEKRGLSARPHGRRGLSARPGWHAHPLTVAHVDHGIHPESPRVAESVCGIAAYLKLPFEMTRLALGPDASETVAREARYRWLKALARERKAWLFTAHHRDDQVETVLMRVLKGSGPAGLAGIAAVSGMLVRPLLPFSREEIHSWLASREVAGWDDPSNRDPRHLRSWLRTELLPAVRARIPAFDQRLAGLARQASADRAGWDAVVDLLALAPEREGEGFHFDARPLQGKKSPLVVSAFLAIARRLGHSFGTRSAERVSAMIDRNRSGSRVDLTGGWEAILEFGRVSVRMAPLVSVPPPTDVAIAGESGTAEWAGWRISWRSGTRPEPEPRVGETAWLDEGSYTLRAWRPGDRIVPLGGTGNRLVVRCMQDARIPASLRRQWPVVEDAEQIVWVPQVCRSGLARARNRAMQVTFARS